MFLIRLLDVVNSSYKKASALLIESYSFISLVPPLLAITEGSFQVGIYCKFHLVMLKMHLIYLDTIDTVRINGDDFLRKIIEIFKNVVHYECKSWHK
jgi:hypothetical protein